MITVKINRKELDYFVDEAYKSLRTNLRFCGEDKKVIMMTSCTPAEDKSSVTLNLARSLAQEGKRVLLLDADLRKSILMETVNVESEVKGLTHYLTSQESLTNIIYATDINNLHIIFAGTLPPNPAELLGGKVFKAMIAVMRTVYDYILIDTPLLGNVIDSVVVAEEADGAVLVIESGVISYQFAREVKAQLSMSSCPILGAVLNKVEQSQSRYGKYFDKRLNKKVTSH